MNISIKDAFLNIAREKEWIFRYFLLSLFILAPNLFLYFHPELVSMQGSVSPKNNLIYFAFNSVFSICSVGYIFVYLRDLIANKEASIPNFNNSLGNIIKSSILFLLFIVLVYISICVIIIPLGLVIAALIFMGMSGAVVFMGGVTGLILALCVGFLFVFTNGITLNFAESNFKFSTLFDFKKASKYFCWEYFVLLLLTLGVSLVALGLIPLSEAENMRFILLVYPFVYAFLTLVAVNLLVQIYHYKNGNYVCTEDKTANKILYTILLILVFVFSYYSLTNYFADFDEKINYKKNFGKELQPVKETEIEKGRRFFPIIPTYRRDFWMNDLEEYNGKTKEELYAIRTKHVKDSIFFSDGYTPNEDIFGSVNDKKPWRALKSEACRTSPDATDEEKTGGISEESRFINNPTMLIGVEKGLCYWTDKYDFCHDDLRFFMPMRIEYQPKYNMLTAHYRVRADYLPETFNGMNAKDLGYSYAYAEQYSGFKFKENANISTEVYQFRDFYHVGQSCGVKTGCNNGSPAQPMLNYNVQKLPAHIIFKLWNKPPKSHKDAPDAYYGIVLNDEKDFR